MSARQPSPDSDRSAHRRCRYALWALAAGLLLGGCAAPRPVPEVFRPAAGSYHILTGEARSPAGCRFTYRRFIPSHKPHNPSVIIGHGFLRRQVTLSSLAAALAAAGFQAVTLDLCSMRPWNGHHRRNADTMRYLARHLRLADPVFAGFSAGALAALLAASTDPTATGVLLLDPVDQDGLAASAAGRLQVPVEVLTGTPSACNQQQQVLEALHRSAAIRITRVDGASHCEFEAPSDRFCELVCGDHRDSRAADALQRRDVIARAVRAMHRLERSARRRAPDRRDHGRPACPDGPPAEAAETLNDQQDEPVTTTCPVYGPPAKRDDL